VRPRLPGNSPTVNRITGMHAAGQVAGCGAQLRSIARLPSHFRQSLPAVRVVTHKTEASVRVSPQSAGMEHPGRGCLTISPQPAHEHPTSHPTLTYRVPPSGHTPHGSGWRDGSSKFGRSGPRYARALCSSQLLRHVINVKQRAARAWLANLRPRCVDAGARLGRGVLPSLCSTPARARAPPSHPTVMCRVPPSGRTPQGSGWRAAHHSRRRIL
jgi:hypothetical protein